MAVCTLIASAVIVTAVMAVFTAIVDVTVIASVKGCHK